MHTGTLKKLALALTFWLALHMSLLRAQVFTNDLPLQAITTGSNPVDFEFRADGTMIGKGNFGVGSLTSGDEGAGTRMLWFPSLGAFRAGGVATGYNSWDPASIGAYSSAFGSTTTASGAYSSAFGQRNQATGYAAASFGAYSTASGSYALTFGGTGNTASGQSSVVIGNLSSATAQDSFAKGAMSMATGYGSTAIGDDLVASGVFSTASGYHTQATGKYTSASGYSTTGSAYLSWVYGTFNVGGGNQYSWVPTDPLFELGNGGNGTKGNPAINGPSDAFIVYKNGNAEFQGVVSVAPGGDIPMYTGN